MRKRFHETEFMTLVNSYKEQLGNVVIEDILYNADAENYDCGILVNIIRTEIRKIYNPHLLLKADFVRYMAFCDIDDVLKKTMYRYFVEQEFNAYIREYVDRLGVIYIKQLLSICKQCNYRCDSVIEEIQNNIDELDEMMYSRPYDEAFNVWYKRYEALREIKSDISEE